MRSSYARSTPWWPASSATAPSTAAPSSKALNWAAVYRLPVLFVCEDNRWSATTDSATTTAGAGAAARARALAVPAETSNGNDVEAVCDTAGSLLQAVRHGEGPRLLHALTYRVKGHVSVDPAHYRDPQAHAAALEGDPIARASAALRRTGRQRCRRSMRLVSQALQEIEAAQRVAPCRALACGRGCLQRRAEHGSRPVA